MKDIFDKMQAITGITKLSNSEVITPKNIVKDMADLPSADVFNPDAKFLDPAVKSGRFLIELYHRLMNSKLMIQAFPDEQSRGQYILDNQLYGIATSNLAAVITRKALYNDPNKTGKIVYTEDKVTKEMVQGVFKVMEFDVVIGNPPYNNDAYLDFVQVGHSISSKYTCMITPAKWQAKGGKKNEKFRKDIVPYMSKIVFYPDCGDIFNIMSWGGIAYFLIDKNRQDGCIVSERQNCQRVEMMPQAMRK